MIIVEGMDNSGKTTLCKYLSNKLDIPLFSGKIAKTKKEMISFQYLCMIRNKPIIYDRMRVISEMVYGKIVRGENKFHLEGWYLINLLLKTRPLIIYCRPEDDDIFKFGDREQMDGVVEKSKQLLSRYDQIFQDMRKISERPILCYDWTNRTDILNECSTYSQEQLLKYFEIKTLQMADIQDGGHSNRPRD